MSTIVTAQGLSKLVAGLLTAPEKMGQDMTSETFSDFMGDIAQVVCDYCGGEIDLKAEPLDGNIDNWAIGIRGNDSSPEDGGVWAAFDTVGNLLTNEASTGVKVREAYLARSKPGSADRSVDEFVLERFDNAGLGHHPKFIAMLQAVTSPDVNLAECRKAKEAAYELLNHQNQAIHDEASSVFIQCEESAIGVLKGYVRKVGDYNHLKGGVSATVMPGDLETLARFPADFVVTRPAKSNSGEVALVSHGMIDRAVEKYLVESDKVDVLLGAPWESNEWDRKVAQSQASAKSALSELRGVLSLPSELREWADKEGIDLKMADSGASQWLWRNATPTNGSCWIGYFDNASDALGAAKDCNGIGSLNERPRRTADDSIEP